MSKRSEQLTGFIATVKKPDLRESLAIIAAQKKNPNRQISCTFLAGRNGQYTRTVIPNRDVGQGREVEQSLLCEDMQRADLVQITDLPKR